MNTASDEADVTLLGRPFHNFVPATGKARPPTVDRRQVGTSVEADLSLRRCGVSATHVNDDAKYDGAEPCSAWYISIAILNVIHSAAEPMETVERVSDVVATSQGEDELSCGMSN